MTAEYRQAMDNGEFSWHWHWEWGRPFSILLSELRFMEYTGRKCYVNAFTFWPRIWWGRLGKWRRYRRNTPTARIVRR